MTITDGRTLGQLMRLRAIEVPVAQEIVAREVTQLQSGLIAVGIEEPRYGLPAFVGISTLGEQSWLIEVHINGKDPCYSWRIDVNNGLLEVSGAIDSQDRGVERAMAELLAERAKAAPNCNLRVILRAKIGLNKEDVTGYDQLLEYLQARHTFSPEFREYFDQATGGNI